MVERFEDKVVEKVRNYLYPQDVSLPLHSDKYAC